MGQVQNEGFVRAFLTYYLYLHMLCIAFVETAQQNWKRVDLYKYCW